MIASAYNLIGVFIKNITALLSEEDFEVLIAHRQDGKERFIQRQDVESIYQFPDCKRKRQFPTFS